MNSKCSRCNKDVDKSELDNHLCTRCQDVLEFGYQSFPAYPLEEKELEKELVMAN